MSYFAAVLVLLFIFGTANFVAYRSFALDKQRAINGLRRIPERKLLRNAFWGGSIGAKLAQHRLRHKTYKQPFGLKLNLICAFHVGLLIWVIYSGLWFDILRSTIDLLMTFQSMAMAD